MTQVETEFLQDKNQQLEVEWDPNWDLFYHPDFLAKAMNEAAAATNVTHVEAEMVGFAVGESRHRSITDLILDPGFGLIIAGTACCWAPENIVGPTAEAILNVLGWGLTIAGSVRLTPESIKYNIRHLFD